MSRTSRSLEPPAEVEYSCPLCGAENPEHIFEAPGEGAVGCSTCLCAYEPWEYFDRLKGGTV